jgi:hypothetical protein
MTDPAFDQELLLWLGDESAAVRAADAERVRDIAAEFAKGFDVLSNVTRAVTMFGSARTPRTHPDYTRVREVAATLGRAGYAIITGGGPGLMEAANAGARDAGALSWTSSSRRSRSSRPGRSGISRSSCWARGSGKACCSGLATTPSPTAGSAPRT